MKGEFPDQRLKGRFAKLLSTLGQKIGDTIPAAREDWAATKAAFRFFSNLECSQNSDSRAMKVSQKETFDD